MPIPLLWLGAATVATLAGIKHSHRIAQHHGHADVLPGDSQHRVKPVNGAVLCCEVYNLLDHTGIWIDDRVIELNGNGLIRAISPDRFLAERSGDNIYLACDEYGHPVVTEETAQRAVAEVYQYRDYDLLNNNCHRFVWQMITGRNQPVNRFTELNQYLSQLHNTPIHWHLADIPHG